MDDDLKAAQADLQKRTNEATAEFVTAMNAGNDAEFNHAIARLARALAMRRLALRLCIRLTCIAPPSFRVVIDPKTGTLRMEDTDG